jgi:hypothetical protein
MRSSVTASGAAMITSSACLHAITLSARSCAFSTGRFAPLLALTASSFTTPTRTKSPIARALRSKSAWPAWKTSKAPRTYTTVEAASRGAARGTPPMNPATRRAVAQKCCRRREGRRSGVGFGAVAIGRGGEEDAVDDVRRAHALGALDRLELPRAFRGVVRVRAVRKEARVVSVDDVVDVVLVVKRLHERLGHVVGHAVDDFVHEAVARDDRAALRLEEHGRAFAPRDLRVRDDPDDQDVAARLGLSQRVRVAEVREVEAPVHVHANGLPRARGPAHASGEPLQPRRHSLGSRAREDAADRRDRRRRGERDAAPRATRPGSGHGARADEDEREARREDRSSCPECSKVT